jgi:hypothetical protein
MELPLHLVGIVDRNQRRRDAIAALLNVELGIRAVVAESVLAPAGPVFDRSTKLIIFGWSLGDDYSEIEIGLARAFFPNAHLIGIGPSPTKASAIAVRLDFPQNAQALIAEVTHLLAHPGGQR